MPRRSCRNVGQFVFHVFNRAIESLVLFEHPADYDGLMRIMKQAMERYPMRILAYVVMPNHWHLIVWPDRDGALSPFMQWMTETHARRWRDWRGSTGRGAVYQGRFKAVPIQRDDHLLRACRYVERNPVRARLVARAEDWRWSSASELPSPSERLTLTPWPVPKPADWLERLEVPDSSRLLEEIRSSVRKGVPFGNVAWRAETMKRLVWLEKRGRGRPRTGCQAIDQVHVL